MKVRIKETGEIKELTAIDCASGCEWSLDLIGNSGAFSDGTFQRVDGEWLCDQDTYRWWVGVIEDLNAADRARYEARLRGTWTDEDEEEYQSLGALDLDAKAAAARKYTESVLAR